MTNKEKDSEELFEGIITVTLDFANIQWSEGESVPSNITGLDLEGQHHVFEVDFPPNRKADFYDWVGHKFRELDIRVGWLFAEAWMPPPVRKEGMSEIQDFQASGGSLEFWPGSTEVFIIEVCDGEYYQMNSYILNRDGNICIPELNLEKSVKFQKLETAGVESNLTRLFQ